MAQSSVPERRESGVQPNDEIPFCGASRFTVADCEELFSPAVIAAAWLAETLPALAVNVALVAAAATATDGGTVSELLLLESVTVPPPAWDNVTVHVPAAPAVRLAGQLKPVTVGEVIGAAPTVIVPPARVTAWPPGVAP